VIAGTVLPHFPHLPAWCILLTVLMLAWRTQLALVNGAMPSRWWLVALLWLGRPRFASRERFPAVDELRVGIPSELVTAYPLVPSTALVLVAHDYKYDLPVLRHALATDVGYIGMLGSARRGAAIRKLLAEEGVGSAALERIRVPIGLDLGARSAPEIALAILAEIQVVRGGGSGLPMRARPPRATPA